MRSLSCVALALAGCASSGDQEIAPAECDVFGLPAVRAPLLFPSNRIEVTLAWLVKELARLSGQELAVAPELQAELEAEIEPLELATPVPAHEVYAYVEGMLATRSIVIAPVKGGERPVLGVYGETAGVPAAAPVEIRVDELSELQGHPALLCQLTITFANIDSRQLQTELRWMLVDPDGFQQAVPAGEHGLVLRGNGARILSLARTLVEVDRAYEPSRLPERAEPAGR